MNPSASAPRLVLFLKSKIAHMPGYAFYGGRWHKVHHDKPAPKGAPMAAHPTVGGVHAPIALPDDQIEQLKYPAEKAAANAEMKAFNEKHLPTLLGHAAKGDATAILGSKFGTNTHAKKQVLVANYLLEQMGSTHKVALGQGAGWHATVEHAPADGAVIDEGTSAPAAEPEPVVPAAPSGVDVPAPDFPAKYKTSGFYTKVAEHLKGLADAGQLAELEQAYDADQAAWSGKSPNSLALLAYHAALVDAAKAGVPTATPEPAPQVAVSAPKVSEAPAAPKPKKISPTMKAAVDGMVKLGQWDQLEELQPTLEPHVAEYVKVALMTKPTVAAAATAPVEQDPAPAAPPADPGHIPWDKLLLPDTNSNAASVNKKVAALKAAFEGGDVAAIEAMTWGKNTYNIKLAKVAQAAIALMKDGAPTAPVQEAVAPPAAAPVDDGPKEGDTKPSANGGTLVFHDGHWILKDEPAAAEPDPLSGIVLQHTADGHNKQWSGSVQGAKLVTVHGSIGKAQKTSVKELGSEQAAKQALAKLLQEKLGKGYKAVGYAEGTGPAVAAAPTPKPAAKPAPAAVASALPSMDEWEQIGPQGGSNPGGKFKAPDGTEYYCKFPGDADIAKSEVLAAKLYAAAGLASQDAMLVTKGGKVGIASKWVEVKKGKTSAALAKAPDARGGFAVDAWLANWDVVGLGYDNLQIGADGKAVRVDAGGSLEYRAQGSKKPFGPQVTEIDTLRDPAKAPQAASIFGKMSPADITASVAKVAAVSDADIKALVEQFGPGDAQAKKALTATLIARKADLLAKYPKAALAVAKNASWVRLAPGERVVETGEKFGVQWAKIKVPAKGFHADAIPAPPNFLMNGSQGPTGTWKSSVKHVNEANNEAGKIIFDTAIGSKAADQVAGLHFDAIDKSTGLKTGTKVPFAQHPAGEIKEYFKQVTAELEAQTKATYKTVQNGSFTQSYSSAAMSMAAEFAPVDYAGFKAHAAKAADYLVLNKSAAAGLPAPDAGIFEEQWENLSPKLIAFKKECSTKYATLTSSEQAACKAYTGSSYANWNQALRSGDTTSNAYMSAQAMVKGFAKAAIDIPEGTILWRGIGVGEDTYKSVAGAVIQDGSFQSSSFGSSPAFSGHSTWLKIHVGKGVKGLHATTFSHFGSGEREIIIKNNVRYAVLNVTHHKNFVDSKGKSHGPKTIVDLMALPHEN